LRSFKYVIIISLEYKYICVCVCVCLYGFFRSVGSKFNLGKSSLSRCVRRVIKALLSLSAEIISWPKGDHLLDIKTKFRRMSGLSNVVGVVDGSHIEIPAPEVS